MRHGCPGVFPRPGRELVNKAGATVRGMEEVLRTIEESADTANLLALEIAIEGWETAPVRQRDDQLAEAADRAVRATADMACLLRSSGLF
ncbi:chemotaxis protein [Geobacter hydrogenophilus]|nr:chemotaxis protein [Geobacter hydrogenophilus]